MRERAREGGGRRYYIYINNLETEPSLRHFTDQTTEATISKFGSGVLYSIGMEVGIIKSVLIKGFMKKKSFFLCQLCILKIGFGLILPIRAVLINYHKKRERRLHLQYKGFPLYLGSHESHHASFHNY